MENKNTPKKKIERLPELMGRIGLGRSAIYERVAAGKFPQPIRLGTRAVGWLSSEVDEWLEKLAAERVKG